jgi:hypothetical protein
MNIADELSKQGRTLYGFGKWIYSRRFNWDENFNDSDFSIRWRYLLN